MAILDALDSKGGLFLPKFDVKSDLRGPKGMPHVSGRFLDAGEAR